MARAGDHFMRINAKAILMIASIGSIYAKPSFSMTQFFSALRAFTYVGYCVKDINTILGYGLSGMDHFETAIFADYSKFLD